VKPPRILAVASATDLDFRYGCTPAWWQLWKGLYEAGCDLIVTPYRGRAVESPWWRTYPNPCYREGELFDASRRAAGRLAGGRIRRIEDRPPDTASDKAVRTLISRWVTPRWKRHLERIVERERGVDAVIVFTVPMSHLRGIPTALRERFDVPVVYYDGDLPASLPEFGGLDTGFNIYHGADPGEYDLMLSNSEGAIESLIAMGARRAEALFWAVDPGLFAPLPVAKEHDVFFYGYGDRFRRDWMAEMVGEPSRRLPEVDFVLGGADFRGDTGAARAIGDVPFNVFSRAVSASRINLNITRRPHATVPGSSSARPFELAACGAAIVSNPYEGLEQWFEPGSEVRIVSSADESVEAYDELLADPGAAEEMGRRARERALSEHTYAQRARRLLDLIGLN
jgi:Glycosyl transferases group 1